MEVALVPVLDDNYAYLLIDSARREAAAIDAVEPEKVLARAKELGVTVTTILTTHSHWDHAGGNAAMKALAEQQLQQLHKQLQQDDDTDRQDHQDHQHQKQQLHKQPQLSVPVVGGRGDGVQAATLEVAHGDVVRVGGLEVRVLQTPCHTRGHVLYLCGGALFTGDTLFVAGCGRFFSGTAAEMHHALNGVVAALAPETLVYCGHEYTASNLRFAAHVEPANAAVRAKLAWAVERSRRGEPTVPSTVRDELATNPFMRVREPAVQQFAVGSASADLAAVMGALRAAKDQFGVGKGKI